MSGKLCLQWNEFKENANALFENLREDHDFTDVTLACEDGKQVDAHKVIFFFFFLCLIYVYFFTDKVFFFRMPDICMFFYPQGDLGSIKP